MFCGCGLGKQGGDPPRLSYGRGNTGLDRNDPTWGMLLRLLGTSLDSEQRNAMQMCMLAAKLVDQEGVDQEWQNVVGLD